MIHFLNLACVVALVLPTTVLAQDAPLARWPQFRGRQGTAVAADAQALPATFGPATNVLWKVALPLGFSSPCIWDDRIFLTGFHPASQKLETLCLDRQSGAVRWRQPAPAAKIERVYKVNSPASATPATDGQRVYVSFGSYGLLCYDLDGKELWRRPLPTPRTSFGSATSPVVSGDLLLLNGQGKDHHLLAVSAATGATVWTTEGTPFPSDYPVPLLWTHNQVTEVIVPGKGGLLAYNLMDGSRRWWIPGLSPEAASSPAQGEGLLFVASHLPGGDPDVRMKLPAFEELLKHDKNKDGKLGRKEVPTDQFIFSRGGKDGVGDLRLHQMFWLFDKNGDGHIDRQEWQAMLTTPFTNSLLAIRPGGLKDISRSHVVWQARRGVPEVPSPLYYQGRIYMVRNGGVLTCVNAKTGTDVFPRTRLGQGGLFYASPVAGDGKVYFASDAGIVTVLKAGDRFEVLAENDLGESIRATPALVDGKVYLRTAGHLYAFGGGAASATETMNTPSATVPIEKSIVLVGAGNAHLVFLKRWGMRPIPGVAVTLVNEGSVIPYSAMVPGHIAGDYTWDEITIDLVRLCQNVNVRFVAERVTRIDPARRFVCFADRPPLTYDALSVGLGSISTCPANLAGAAAALVMRPLSTLIHKLDSLAQRLQQTPSPFHLVVVGGGASGCELTAAIQKRLGRAPGFRVTLLQGNPQLLQEFPAGVAQAFAQVFHQQGITFRLNARVAGGEDGALLLSDGTRVAADAVLWATQASPPPLLRESGLAVDAGGFLQVRDTLQSVSDPAVFGTGDCVSFGSYPDLPRNGVHAVREGAILSDNLFFFLREEPLRRFRPQRYCLCLLNTADGTALLRYGPFTWKARWAKRLKDRIDRAWILKFTQFTPMTEPGEPETLQMRCGGCGSKISSDVLSAVLKRLDIPDDPRILLGCRAGEDAAVHRVRPDLFGREPDRLLEVQTVDYFKAFVDDPYLFGRIAALNAISDLYAMNARPFSALAIATLPYARGPVQEAQLYELLSGAVASFRELGVVLTGGHTTEGSELALGFAVTGFGEEGRLFQKSNLQPGDALVLTKPLGSGALLAAWMRGDCRAVWFEQLIAAMLTSNARAGAIFAQAGVVACTDVTGFGLAGHLLEMLDSSRVSARLRASSVPLYSGFKEVVGRGIVSSLHQDNAKTACRVSGTIPAPAWLFDPQTSGGLLAAVNEKALPQVLEELHAAGLKNATVIGQVISAGSGKSSVISVD